MARVHVAGLAVAGALALTGCGVNDIPTQEEAAKAAWAEVQTQYQRRADLIPNLVATVQGAAAQERDVLTAVTEARAGAQRVTMSPEDLADPAKFAQYQAAQDRVTMALRPFYAMQEQYPQLRSLENFTALQGQLEGTENRIQIARRDYNEAVRVYNTTLRTFPQVIWASTVHSGSRPMSLFAAAAGADQAPTVTFGPAPGAAPGGAAGGGAAPAPGSAPGSAPGGR
jgi:LemA protein